MNVAHLLAVKGHKLETISPTITLYECLKVLEEKQVGILLAIEEPETFAGVISERDILRALFEKKERAFDMLVSEVMTPREKIISTGNDVLVEEVMEIMTEKRIRHLPVMTEGKISGLISIGDVVKCLHDQAVKDNLHLKNYIHGHYR